jgi:lipopolysaccharide/colanic/teichoic acid biosynthesis glycosyltransferase
MMIKSQSVVQKNDKVPQLRKNVNDSWTLAGRIIAFILMPVVFLLSLLYLPFILISSKEAPIWHQKRVGFKGRDIYVPKFSTMNIDSSGVYRETWFGYLARPLGLDEILQVWSIVKGEMQWFGPRPFIRTHLNTHYIQAILHYTKPGFFNSRSLATGIGNSALEKGNLSIDDLMKYDLKDLQNWSAGYALKLFFSTLLMISRTAANKTR